MARWENFSIWKGRFPHWRAEGVEYYVSFPHRRPLTEPECDALFGHLMRAHGRSFEYLALVVVPEKTEAVLSVGSRSDGEAFELNDVISKAQRRFLKQYKSTERLFYAEPYDRIIRDEAEREGFIEGMLSAIEGSDAIESADEWTNVYFAESAG